MNIVTCICGVKVEIPSINFRDSVICPKCKAQGLYTEPELEQRRKEDYSDKFGLV